MDENGNQRERGLGTAEAFWHTDMSYKPVPPARVAPESVIGMDRNTHAALTCQPGLELF